MQMHNIVKHVVLTSPARLLLLVFVLVVILPKFLCMIFTVDNSSLIVFIFVPVDELSLGTSTTTFVDGLGILKYLK